MTITVKIIWGLICLNLLGLLVFVAAYFILTQGKNVDAMEKGWTVILAGAGLLVILLAAVPLRFSQAGVALVFSGFFAALPSVIALGIFLSNKIPSVRKEKTYAETYYSDKTQRGIAEAIEQNDTVKLKRLITGQDLNIQGDRVWDWDGLNYLQFAIRIRSNTISTPYNDEANTAAIRILVEHGSATTPALVDAVKCLPLKTLTLLLDAGADPNVKSPYNGEPVLIGTIGTSPGQNDKALLLVQKGADINAKASNGYTAMMYTANNAGTGAGWSDAWRVIRYLLVEARADFTYTTKDGISLQTILRRIREEAAAGNVTMPPDFDAVVAWLKQHQVDTEPAQHLQPESK